VYRYADSGVRWAVALYTEEDAAVALAADPDGVIAMVRTPGAAAALERWGGPVVDAACDLDDLPFARVRLDPAALGRAAADHLLTLQGRRYASVGDPATPAGRRSREGFVDRLRRAGHGCEVAPGRAFDRPYHTDPAADRAAAAWVASLPRPAAVFAAHDALAHRLAEACRAAGLRVPEDVALLGCLNDEFLCTASQPTLSSVAGPLPAVGFEAGRVLDRMMNGAPPPARPVEFPPVGVVIRQSSDPTAVSDPGVSAALRFIRDHAAERVGVGQIASAAGLSRSTLERRFRAAVGRGPLAELLRQRVDRARHLLAETDLAVKQVARAAGFHDTRHLSATFRQKAGASPTEFRARFRPG
jgi:LacI family transcriptional regulator